MLYDLKKTLTRLQATEPSSSPLPELLGTHCKWYSDRIRRVQDCSCPSVKRILAEDVLESVDWILYLPSEKGQYSPVENTTLWQLFRKDILSGRVMDFEYVRYKEAKRFVKRWLEHSYTLEVRGPDEKTQRYAYALSGESLPEWFQEDLLVPRLEAIVTAYCNMLIIILDYAENCAVLTASKELLMMEVITANLQEDYLTPEIGQALPMLDETCAMLTQQSLILALTETTKEWVQGDPELADILVEKKKSLEECVRYIMEQAAKVAKTNIEAMTDEQMRSHEEKVHGQQAFMAGFAISSEQVFQWAKDYYYKPDVKPTSATAANTNKAAGQPAPKTATKKKNGKKAEKAETKTNNNTGSKPEGAASAGADAPAKMDVVDKEPEQFSLFPTGESAAA